MGACKGTPRHPDAAPVPRPADARSSAEGLTIETIDDLTLVRIDLSRYALTILAKDADGGGARTVMGWARDFGQAAVVNASMYTPEGRSIGMLIRRGDAVVARDNPKLGGFLAFDPVDAADPPAVIAGRECPGFELDALRRRYRSIVQDYRLFDCDGKPIAWADADAHPGAAIAVDRDGRVVFALARAPRTTTELATRLADPALGLAGAIYVEGGSEASLYAGDVREGFWPLPNVVAAAPRLTDGATPSTSAP